MITRKNNSTAYTLQKNVSLNDKELIEFAVINYGFCLPQNGTFTFAELANAIQSTYQTSGRLLMICKALCNADCIVKNALDAVKEHKLVSKQKINTCFVLRFERATVSYLGGILNVVLGHQQIVEDLFLTGEQRRELKIASAKYF